MAYHNKSFSERFALMGDLAETQFEKWASRKEIAFVDYGLKRPPFKKFYTLPLFVRGQPDYLCESSKGSHFFVEVKGTGGRVVRIKQETLDVAAQWNTELAVWFFIYDSNNHRAAFLNYRQLVEACKGCVKKAFDDGRDYYEVPAQRLAWEALLMEDKDGERSNESDERST